MMKINITLCCLFLSVLVSAQEVLMEEEYEPVKEEDITGANAKTFAHTYLNFGAFIDQPLNSDVEMNYGTSNQIQMGYRYKIKLNNVFSVIGDLGINRSKLSYDRNLVLANPNDPALPDQEYIRFYQVFAAPGLRFNFDPNRGNFMGIYLDLTVYGGYSFASTNILKFDEETDNYENSIVKYNGLSYLEKFNYGLKARVGYSKYALVVQYRLSDLITTNNLPQFGLIGIGFEYGLYSD